MDVLGCVLIDCRNVIMSTYAKLGKLDEVSAAFQNMKLSGVQPDDRSYTIIISAHAKSHDVSGAEKYMREMRECGRVPTVGIFNAVIALYGQEKMMDKVDELVKEMNELNIGNESTPWKTAGKKTADSTTSTIVASAAGTAAVAAAV